MARAKKSQNKVDSESTKDTPEKEDATSLGEVVQDAVILEEGDQAGVPESSDDDNAGKKATESDAETADAIDPESITTESPELDTKVKEDVANTEKAAAQEPEIQSRSEVRGVVVPEPQRSSGGGITAMLLGGVCAAAIGFGAAQYNSGSWPFASDTPDYDALTGEMADLSDGMASLEARLAEATAVQSDIDALRAAQESAQLSVSALGETLASFDQRLTDLENRPIPDVGATRDAVAAYQEQLAGMRAMFEEELERIEAAQARSVEQEQTAAEQAEAALQRTALAQLKSALDSGAPYLDLLETLSRAAEIPAALSDHAASGLPTLAGLQRSYPEAAREALNTAIRSQADAGQIDNFTAFLRTQLGTRSLEPKEGEDPDAVLSRAEAALRDGNLADTINELQSLPDAGREAMAGWMATAQVRLDAIGAFESISNSLNN